MITVENKIVRFIPQHLLLGMTIRKNKGSTDKHTSVDVEDLKNWNKTRFGYVEGKGMFYQEMMNKSPGEFQFARSW